MRNAVQVGVCGTQVRNLNMLDVVIQVVCFRCIVSLFNPVADWQNLTSVNENIKK